MAEETIVENSAPAEAAPVEETPASIVEYTPMDDVQFDFLRLTARQAHGLNAIIRGGDLLKKAEIFAALCSALPEGWGDPSSVDTFMDLPLWGPNGLLAVQKRFMKLFVEYGDPVKN